MSSVHDALDLVARIDARGGPARLTDRARYVDLRRQVFAAARNADGDLGSADELGAWPFLVAQLAAIAAGMYIAWHVAEPVVTAARVTGPVITYGAGAWLLWWLFYDRRRGAPSRRGGKRRKIVTTEYTDPYAPYASRSSYDDEAGERY